MGTSTTDFVMNHPLFSHHDHHWNFKAFDEGRPDYDFTHLLGYAEADLVTSAGARPKELQDARDRTSAYWPTIRTTGYGRAVTLGCRQLFGLDYAPEHFAEITAAMQSLIEGKTAAELFDYFVRETANNRWVLQDHHFGPHQMGWLGEELYPDYYRFAWRMDELFWMPNAEPIKTLERATGKEILSLNDLVVALNANIDTFKETGKLAALKLGIAYRRDLVVSDPCAHDAERAFSRIRNPNAFHDGKQQVSGAVSARATRPLADYMLHCLMRRAHDEDLPVQIHTGYLAGHWGSLEGTRAMNLIPVFDKYRRVRFDLFHASWPWASELGAIAKNYPNVYPNLCWAWAMNPAESERVLSEWLDAVPFNKIFGYGADTELPWCNVGYSIQARRGIARVLEQKVKTGHFSPSTAEEVASAIMLRNGESFFGLG